MLNETTHDHDSDPPPPSGPMPGRLSKEERVRRAELLERATRQRDAHALDKAAWNILARAKSADQVPGKLRAVQIVIRHEEWKERVQVRVAYINEITEAKPVEADDDLRSLRNAWIAEVKAEELAVAA